MANFKTRHVKKLVILSMLLTGGALFVYSFFQGSGQSTIPGWTAVNEPLTFAIENLSVAQSPSPSGQQAAEQLPDSSPSQSAEAIVDKELEPTNHNNSSSPLNSTLLDLNQATQSQLETLPSIGPSKAKAIIAYREKQNGFQNINQLLEVKGIGAKVYDRISPLVQIASKK